MKNFLQQLGGVLLVIGVVLMVINFKYVGVAFKEPVDIYVDGVESADDIKSGLAIETETNVLLECFGSMQTTTKSRRGGSVSTQTDYYYIMPIFVGDETYYVAFEVKEGSDDFSKYKKISNDTMNLMAGTKSEFSSTSVTINGGLHKLDGEIYDHMKEWFEDSEWFESDSDIDKYVLPLVFESQSDETVIIIFFVSIGLIAIGLSIIIIPAVVRKKKAKAVQSNQNIA